MAVKITFFVFALLVGCMAIPTPQEEQDDYFLYADSEARIVGGTQAAAGSHPHMVALSSGLLIRSFICGGSIVSTRTVITAAHCVDAVFSFGSLSSTLRATVGTNRWNSGGQVYGLSRNVSHPNYLANTYKNDISLLITSTNIMYTTLVSPIALSFDNIPGGVPARVAGWGRTRTNGALSAVLLEIILDTMDGQACVDDVAQAAVTLNVRAPIVEPHIELCTFHSVNFGTCRGDSGSALVQVSDGRQIGVVSWGFPCARGAPDMFVRVSGFTSWLQQNII